MPVEVSAIQIAEGFLVRIRGALNGTSIPYAVKRRERIRRLTLRAAQSLNVHADIVLEVEDQISTLQGLVKSIATKVLGHTAEIADFKLNRVGHLSVAIAALYTGSEDRNLSLKLKSLLELVLSEDRVKVDNVYILRDEDKRPAGGAILRAVKTQQPVGLVSLERQLNSQGFKVPRGDWLNHQLDRLRQHGLVLRRRDDLYVLTGQGLQALPGTTNRGSSDIERTMSIGRIKW